MATYKKLHGAKRILSAITAALIAATTLSAMTVTSAAEDTTVIDQTIVDDTDGKFTLAEIKGATSTEWQGKIATGFDGGTGTQSSPYQIATGEQLAYLAQEVDAGTTYSGKYFELTADILLNDDVDDEPTEWEPIGGYYSSSTSYSFEGNFNGNNHSVIGLYINDTSNYESYMGLFGRNAGIISNLTVTDGRISCSGHYVGVISGYNSGTIKNCYTSVRVASSSNYDEFGGICGRNGGKITNCTNKGELYITGGYSSSSKNYIGGICGRNYSTIDSCTNIGRVYTTNYAYYVGGICGSSTGTVKNCNNTAVVNAYRYAGGICGENTGNVKESYNTGAITSRGSYAGGVCACSYSDDATDTILSCYNTGKVTSNASYAGGVCGSLNGNLIRDCYNTGKVISDNHYIGGICGYVTEGSIKSCYNEGKINGGSNDYVGGITGYLNVNANIYNCYNKGDVTGDEYVAGIWGYSADDAANFVDGCINLGDVTGTKVRPVGWMVGQITNCYYDTDVCSVSETEKNKSMGKTTAQLTADDALTALGLDSEVWNKTANTTYYWYYPDLASIDIDSEYILAGVPAPTGVKAGAGNAKVQVKWNAVEGAESYRVMVWDGSAWTGYTTTDTSYIVRNLTNGKTYGFAVKAYAMGLYSDISTTVYATPVDDTIIPTGVKASSGDGKVQVKWNAVSGATSYRVMTWDGESWTGQNSTTTSCMVRNLINGKKYAFAVKAYVKGAYGATSATVYATPAASIIPTGVKVGAGDAKVQVKWNAVANATSYRVMVWDGAKWTGYSTASTSYMVRNLTNNKKYAFAVKAYVSGAYGATCSTLYAVPHNDTSIIPTGVKAGAGNAKVQVKWNTVYGASSYRVMVWDGTKWTGYTTTDTTYMVRNLTNGKKYAFVVKAYINGAYSANSTTVYATPTA